MKHVRTALLVAAIAAALAVPASAFAYSDTSRVEFDTGLVCNGCLVTIHNLTTGANGSTRTNSQGYWSASGFVAGYNYQAWAAYFIGSCSYSNRNFDQWTQRSSNMTLDELYVYSTPVQSGCPILTGQ
jgi:hypothetical protein